MVRRLFFADKGHNDKEKEIETMAEFNFDELKKTISDAAEVVTKKTSDFVSVQKLKGQIYALERSVDKKYQELGAIVFEQYGKGEQVNDESTIVCEEISQVNVNISELREELASKHGCTICPVCESEVSTEAMFCMKCGAQMPEPTCECTTQVAKCDCNCGCGCTEDGSEEAKDELVEEVDSTPKETKEIEEQTTSDDEKSEE